MRQKLVARRDRREKAVDVENNENDAIKTLSRHTNHSNNSPSTCHAIETFNERNKIKINVSPTRMVDSPVNLQTLSLDETSTPFSSSSSLQSMNQSQSSHSSVIRNNQFDSKHDDESVVEIELIECDHCKRSFSTKVYKKHFDQNGQPKCAMTKKRAIYNSAKVSANNSMKNE